MSAGSSQPADRAVGAVPVDHPEGSTSPTPLPSGSAAAGAHRPSEDCSQPADERIETITWALLDAEPKALAALAAVAAELAELRARNIRLETQEISDALNFRDTELAELREALDQTEDLLAQLGNDIVGYQPPGYQYVVEQIDQRIGQNRAALSRGATP